MRALLAGVEAPNRKAANSAIITGVSGISAFLRQGIDRFLVLHYNPEHCPELHSLGPSGFFLNKDLTHLNSMTLPCKGMKQG